MEETNRRLQAENAEFKTRFEQDSQKLKETTERLEKTLSAVAQTVQKQENIMRAVFGFNERDVNGQVVDAVTLPDGQRALITDNPALTNQVNLLVEELDIVKERVAEVEQVAEQSSKSGQSSKTATKAKKSGAAAGGGGSSSIGFGWFWRCG